MKKRASKTTAPDANWTSGEAYKNYVGRWSRLVAAEFISWLDAPRGVRWLDVGCGTGELTRSALNLGAGHVTGIDQSEAYITYARERSSADAEFRVGDATALPVENDSFEVAVSGLVINFVPEPRRAIEEMARATKSGGIVAAYVWDYAGGMQLMRHFWDAAAHIDPRAADLDEGSRFPICREGALGAMFESVGLGRVETRPIVVPTPFRNFDDYWQPFLGNQGLAPKFAMSLSAPNRDRLREYLRGQVPTEPDGSVRMTARALAAKGMVL
ncbi:MAG: methyltransferase domain-containing protein [Dehalococcoidia bacterium]